MSVKAVDISTGRANNAGGFRCSVLVHTRHIGDYIFNYISVYKINKIQFFDITVLMINSKFRLIVSIIYSTGYCIKAERCVEPLLPKY